MRYIVEVTHTDHRTGKIRTWRDRKGYKTLMGAERAAARWNIATKPDGRNITTETRGRVVPA